MKRDMGLIRQIVRRAMETDGTPWHAEATLVDRRVDPFRDGWHRRHIELCIEAGFILAEKVIATTATYVIRGATERGRAYIRKVDAECERLARRACAADGYEPDRQTFMGEPKRGPFGSSLQPNGASPAWTRYRGLVYAVLDELPVEVILAGLGTTSSETVF